MLIYKITNLKNGKVYVGKHKGNNPQVRWRMHCGGHGKAPLLWRAISKYGEKNFSVSILTPNCVTEGHSNAMEKYWINRLRSNLRGRGYNLTAGGEGVFNPSEETRRKRSKSLRGNKNSLGFVHSKETRLKMSRAHKGKHFSQETCRRMRSALKGRPVSERTRRILRLVKLGNQNAKGPHKRRKINV